MKNKNNMILNVIKKKKKVLITCEDVCRSKYCSKSNDDIKNSIIKKCIDYLDSTLDEHSIAINSIRHSLLFKMMFEKDQREIFHIPSINVNIEDNQLLEELVSPKEDNDNNNIKNINDEVKAENHVNQESPDCRDNQDSIHVTSPDLSKNAKSQFEIAETIKLDNRLNQDLVENYLKSNL